MKMRMTAALAIAAMGPVALSDTITVGPNFVDYDYITITAAIANAVSGDEILIQPGLYAENLAVIDKDLTLRNAGGGVVTVFGQDLDKCFRSTGTSTDVVLDGLTFTRGFSTSAGGGVSIEGGSRATIVDCVIEDSNSTSFGGGLYMSGGGTVTNTIIRNNTSLSNGGGMDLRGTVLKTFVDCVIEGNEGVEGGGVSYSGAGVIASFEGCRFIGNTASVRGGAIAVLGNSLRGDLQVRTCWFEENRGETAGGAVWVSDQDVFQAINSVFVRNSAGTDGGAIRNEQLVELIQCTLYENSVDSMAAGTLSTTRSDGVTRLYNSIVVNQAATSHSGTGVYSRSYSILPEAPTGSPDANGNFDANPMFVDAAGDDFRLMAGSPAIDAANSRGEYNAGGGFMVEILDLMTDYNGDVRNLDDPATANIGVSAWELCIDMGAFEFQPSGASDCPADLTGDGVLNFFDVSAFLSEYNMGCP